MVDVVDKGSVVEEEERRSALKTTGHLTWVRALAVFLCVVVPPLLVRPTVAGKLRFDEALLSTVNALAPDYVFIGNSMLQSRLDGPTLEARLGAKCCYILWTGGAESAWMHQALKNIALAGVHKPKRVFIFFRDTYLTQPTYRATDRYWWRIERLSHATEPQLDRAMSASRTWQEQMEYQLATLYPIQKLRDRVSPAVSWLASDMAALGRRGYDASAGQTFDGVFELDKLRGVAADDTAFHEADGSEFDFDAHVATSLLPSMIRLAEQAHTGLIFVRVQRRPTREGPPVQPPALLDYVQKFRAYVTRQGAEFYDFNGDPELTLDRYLDGDHIDPAWKRESTDLFLRRLARYFQ